MALAPADSSLVTRHSSLGAASGQGSTAWRAGAHAAGPDDDRPLRAADAVPLGPLAADAAPGAGRGVGRGGAGGGRAGAAGVAGADGDPAGRGPDAAADARAAGPADHAARRVRRLPHDLGPLRAAAGATGGGRPLAGRAGGDDRAGPAAGAARQDGAAD